MSFGNVLTRLYDAFSSVLISIRTFLRGIFSFVLIHIYIYLLEFRKQTRWIIFSVKTQPFLFIVYLFMFTRKPALVLQSILLIVHVLFLLVWENERFYTSFFHKFVNSKIWLHLSYYSRYVYIYIYIYIYNLYEYIRNIYTYIYIYICMIYR